MNIRRAAGALVLVAALPLAGCSGRSNLETVFESAPTSAVSTSTSAVSSPSGTPSVTPSGAASVGPSSGPSATSTTQAVSPERQLLHRLQSLTSSRWPTLTDSRTGASFALPAAVPVRSETANGVTQRRYAYQLTPQTGISVGFIHGPSPAAAQALLQSYPGVLRAGVQALGADDAQIVERRDTTIAGHPAVMFRLAFTPTTVPQIPPVWLVGAVASGADIVLLQTIVFPASLNYDFASPARRVQQRLVTSFGT